MFSSNFICTESSRCLVSNGLGLVLFEAIVVKISRLEWRWCKAEKFWTSFLEKIHIFQTEADIFKPFWWKLDKTLFVKIFQPASCSSCPIGTVYCTKSGKKLPVFLKNTLKNLLGFWYFCDISSFLIPIFVHKLSFWRKKYSLWDGLKFNMIQRLDKKVNFLTIPG